MIRQGWRQGRTCRGGAKGAIFSATPAQGGPANTNLQGDKKFVDGGGGGDNCGSPGPQRYNGPGPHISLSWPGLRQ